MRLNGVSEDGAGENSEYFFKLHTSLGGEFQWKLTTSNFI